MRIAYITNELPRPGEAGHLAYGDAILNHLAEAGHEISVILVRLRYMPLIQRTGKRRVLGRGLLTGRGWVMIVSPRWVWWLAREELANRLGGRLSALIRPPPPRDVYDAFDAVLGTFVTPAEAKAAARRAADADWVIADTIFRAPVLSALPPGGPRRAILAHDVFHARHAAFAARGMRLHPPTLSAEDEARHLAAAALIVAIQPDEASMLARLALHARVLTVPMAISPVPRPESTRRDPLRLAFVGSLSTHNNDGLLWFVSAVWPLLRAREPDLRLDVCGTVCRAVAEAPEGVTLHGQLPSLAPVLHRAGLAISPLRAGSGLKIKLLDYAAHGLATVTTTIGAAGFERTQDWPFEIADDAPSFAEAILSLAAGDPLARESRAYAYAGLYRAERVFAPLLAALAQ